MNRITRAALSAAVATGVLVAAGSVANAASPLPANGTATTSTSASPTPKAPKPPVTVSPRNGAAWQD